MSSLNSTEEPCRVGQNKRKTSVRKLDVDAISMLQTNHPKKNNAGYFPVRKNKKFLN